MTDNSTTLVHKLLQVASQHADKTAVQIKRDAEYERLSYIELIADIKRVACWLQRAGLKNGDTVAIALENCPEWGVIYFAILAAGCVAVPLDHQATVEDMRYFLTHAQAKAIFTASSFFQRFGAIVSDVSSLQKIVYLDAVESTRANTSDLDVAAEVVVFNEIALSETDDKLFTKSLTEIKATQLASILYTSGTTGKPKGVMLTHANFYANFSAIEQYQLIRKHENILAILPLYHSFPFMVTLLVPLLTGNKITYIADITLENVTACLREAEITVFPVVPQIVLMLVQRIKKHINTFGWGYRWLVWLLINTMWLFRKYVGINLSKLVLRRLHAMLGTKLRFFVCGGAKLDFQAELFMSKLGFTLLQGYGLSETAPVVTFNSSPIKKMGSVGKAIANVEIRIVDPNDRGIGEIAVTGPNVMSGYYKNPEETAAVLKNGWFYTGDLGYLDQDNYLYIVGRKKEMIVLSSGKNITPDEIEAHYLKSKFIDELCVLPLKQNGDEKLVAIIVPSLNHFRQAGIVDVYGKIKWELDSLSKDYPAYKRIMGFTIAKQELPKTHLGKLKRYLITQQYLPLITATHEESLPIELTVDEQQLAETALAKQVFAVLSRELQLTKSISITQHLELDLGVDSLRRIELIAALEKELQLKIPNELMARVFTHRDLIIALQELLAKQKPEDAASAVKAGDFNWHDIVQHDPNAKLLERIDITPRYWSKLFAAFIKGLLHVYFKLFYRLQVIGAENIPRDEPVIICSNHTSFYDGFVIIAAVPSKTAHQLFLLSYSEYFNRPMLHHLIKLMHIISVNQAVQVVDAIQASAYVLRNQKALLLFPEGARSIDENMQQFKKGVGILLQELNVKAVPVYISGTLKAWPRWHRLPRLSKMAVKFGKPVSSAELLAQGKTMGIEDNYQAIASALRERIIELSKAFIPIE